MKKTILTFGLAILSLVAGSQGLEHVIVEKYYVSNAADSIGSIGVLPVGSVTYRIFVDMLPGYKFQAVYGVPGHALVLSTTTSFFNNEDRGATTATYTKSQARNNTVMLDSWLSVGAACVGNFGILKSEDSVATGGATVVNNTVPPILQNNDPSAGIPLTVQDGLYAGSPEAVTTVGLTAADLDIFDATSQAGSTFSTSNGSWASLNGSVGPIPATNRVLIAQMTTNGAFHYELNIQIGTPLGGTENYVASNPVGSEVLFPECSGTLGTVNIPPTVNITAPANGASFITGAVVAVSANATDTDGTVSKVQFFVDNISIGTDSVAPYSTNYTAVAGAHTITAKATDNQGALTTSAGVNITVSSNPPPSVNITAPANGAGFITGSSVAITANATDNGSVVSVEFFVDGVSIGIDNTSPYGVNYTAAVGSHSLTARATDNLGAQTTSAPISITVANNNPPTVNITAPSNGASFVAPAVINITANAVDGDGSVTSVEFFINGLSIGTDLTAGYSMNWTSVIGTAVLTARATDNLGAQTTSSPVTIEIDDPNAPPYKISSMSNTCLSNIFCIPVEAFDTVHNVIGYDVVMNYDKARVIPTGVVTVGNALINPSYVDNISSNDTANGKVNISLYFNSSAPANTNFNGIGTVFCVEFAKTGNFQSVDTAAFSIASLQESYFSGVAQKSASPGKYTTFADSIFNASLRFWYDNSPIAYNVGNPSQHLITNIYGNNNNCNNKSAIVVQPNLAGNFTYSTNNGSSVDIEKDIAGTTDVQPVINGFDAFLTTKVLTSNAGFVPSVYQMIAMDVNMDGVISAGDLSQINQRAVLMIPEFKQAWNYNSAGVSNGKPSKDWEFIDSRTVSTNLAYRISTTFPADDGIGFSKSRVPVIQFCLAVPVLNNGGCPLINTETYKGILVGDVNGNFSSVVPNGALRNSSSDAIILAVSKAEVNNGFLDIPVSVQSTDPVHALDLSLKFTNEKIRFNSIVNAAGYIETLSNYNEADQTLRITSNSLQGYEAGPAVFYVRFSVRGTKISDDDFVSLDGYLNGEKVRIKTGTEAGPDPMQVNIYPNPAREKLIIRVSETAAVELMDAEGRLVAGRKTVSANQDLEMDTHSLSDGVYFVKVYNDQFISTRRIMISN